MCFIVYLYLEHSMKKTKILLVDDDEDDRDFFKIALKKCGISCELTECADGEKLFAYLKKNDAPDYIFLDINMPKVNGIECLKAFQGDDNLSACKIVMHSTAASQLIVEECYSAGAAAYIVKPDNTQALENMIRYCLEKLNEKQSRAGFILNNLVKSQKKALG